MFPKCVLIYKQEYIYMSNHNYIHLFIQEGWPKTRRMWLGWISRWAAVYEHRKVLFVIVSWVYGELKKNLNYIFQPNIHLITPKIANKY